MADDFDIIADDDVGLGAATDGGGGARFPFITRIFGDDSSSVVSIWAIETLAEAGTVVVPVGPAVELKQDLDVLEMLTPVESLISLCFSARESRVQIMSGLLRLPFLWWFSPIWGCSRLLCIFLLLVPCLPASLAWVISLLRAAFFSFLSLARPIIIINKL